MVIGFGTLNAAPDPTNAWIYTYWAGVSDNVLANPDNWNKPTFNPVNSDWVRFDETGGAGASARTLTLGANHEWYGLIFGGDEANLTGHSYVIDASPGYSLTLGAGGIDADEQYAGRVNNSLTINCVLNIGADQTWTLGRPSSDGWWTQRTIALGNTVNFDGNTVIFDGNSTVRFAGGSGSRLHLNSGTTFTGGGELRVVGGFVAIATSGVDLSGGKIVLAGTDGGYKCARIGMGGAGSNFIHDITLADGTLAAHNMLEFAENSTATFSGTLSGTGGLTIVAGGSAITMAKDNSAFTGNISLASGANNLATPGNSVYILAADNVFGSGLVTQAVNNSVTRISTGDTLLTDSNDKRVARSLANDFYVGNIVLEGVNDLVLNGKSEHWGASSYTLTNFSSDATLTFNNDIIISSGATTSGHHLSFYGTTNTSDIVVNGQIKYGANKSAGLIHNTGGTFTVNQVYKAEEGGDYIFVGGKYVKADEPGTGTHSKAVNDFAWGITVNGGGTMEYYSDHSSQNDFSINVSGGSTINFYGEVTRPGFSAVNVGATDNSTAGTLGIMKDASLDYSRYITTVYEKGRMDVQGTLKSGWLVIGGGDVEVHTGGKIELTELNSLSVASGSLTISGGSVTSNRSASVGSVTPGVDDAPDTITTGTLIIENGGILTVLEQSHFTINAGSTLIINDTATLAANNLYLNGSFGGNGTLDKATPLTINTDQTLHIQGSTFSNASGKLTIADDAILSIYGGDELAVTVAGSLLFGGEVKLNLVSSKAGTWEEGEGTDRVKLFTSDSLTAAGYTLPTAAGYTFEIDGNSLYLVGWNFVPIPEPSTWTLFGVGAAIVTIFRRRRAN